MKGVDKTRGQRARALMERLGLTLPQQPQGSLTFGEGKVTPFKPYNGMTGGAANIQNNNQEY